MEVRRRDRTLILVVIELLEKRVGAAIAATAYDDHSPPAPERVAKLDPVGAMLAEQGRRDRGAGRPTKRDRRQMEKMRRSNRSD